MTFAGNPDAVNNQFGEGTFLEWAKNNKRSWKNDRYRVRVLREAFRGKTLGEITPLAIENTKAVGYRLSRNGKRSVAQQPLTVNLSNYRVPLH